MSGWVKVHESWTEEDRVEQLGSDAAMLHLSALSHAARHLTDGLVTVRSLRRLWPVDDLSVCIDRLVELGFWRTEGEGTYLIVDWRDHILTAEEVAQRREADRVRQQRKRRHDAGDHSMCDRCQYVKRHGMTPDVTHGVSHGPVTRPEPNRPEPNRTDPPGEVRDRAEDAAVTRSADALRVTPHPFEDDGSDITCHRCERPKRHHVHQEAS